jgi:putrescine transport system ATP-binding protein
MPQRPGPALEPWQDPAARPFLEIRGLTKAFGETYAVDGVDLDIYRGEFFCLLGASGSGKTTLMRILAGFEQPDQGRVLLDGLDITDMPPYRRPVNMMFQSYALFPHMSVVQNVAFGLEQERLPRRDIQQRVADALALVRLTGLERRRPDQLSGGQRQRVALARALVKRPKLLLLDEPLAALDRKLREHTQFELVNIQEQTGVTFVMVTHDQDEAMTLSTRIAIMDVGRIQQVGAPTTVYEHPANRFVADFIGAVNLFEGRVIGHEAERLIIASAEAGTDLLVIHAQPLAIGSPVAVGLRPEKLQLAAEDAGPSTNRVRGRVEDIAYLGDVSIYHLRLPSGKRVSFQLTNRARIAESPITWDQEVWVEWAPESAVVLAQ